MAIREDLMEMLESEHSKVQKEKIIDYVMERKDRFDVLMGIFLDKSLHWRYNQRAAWPIGDIGVKKTEMLRPYHHEMLLALDNPPHVAVVRNIVRIFKEVTPDEDIEGPLFDKCFGYLRDAKSPVAVRCFSLIILGNIADKYPDLRPELIAEIKDHYDHGTAGFKSSAKRVLKLLS